MNPTRALTTIAVCAVLTLTLGARQGQPPPPGGRGRIGGAGIGAYPQREPGDPAAVERGRGLYGTYCAFCHGADTRGGDGGPNLLRSRVVLDDQHGELIGQVVRAGRPDRGMPALPSLEEAQIADLAAFMHSFRVNGYDVSRERPASILVGDARAGERYFAETCGSCHSATGDLRGIASRITDQRALQQSWLMPGTAGRGSPPPSRPRPATATVTLPSGETVHGQLERADDFVVSIRLADGARRTFRLAGGRIEVELRDALQPHRDLLRTYRDADIHNVTAYLATLK
jgi:mono/diheme cytochrome c family protein